MQQCSAIAARTANSTALAFKTGKAPGNPRHTGHTFVFGGSPNRVEHPQKILVAVSSWTWTSRPITGSYFASTSRDSALVVAMERLYWAGQRNCLVTAIVWDFPNWLISSAADRNKTALAHRHSSGHLWKYDCRGADLT